MSRKGKIYKLLQWYPCLSDKIKEEDIVELPESTIIYSYMHKSGAMIDRKEVENNPKFWKEVKEKEEDYYVITYIDNEGFLYNRDHSNLYKRNDGNSYLYKLDLLEKIDSIKINTIKRLSDGEIFEIGDKVIQPNCKTNTFTIDGFILNCNDKHLLATGGNGGIDINKIEHVKETDYEVLRLMKGGVVYNKHAKDFNKHLENGGKILAVKRIIDNEIFEINDFVKLKSEEPFYGTKTIYTIQGFDNSNPDYLQVDLNTGGKLPINAITHAEKLFTTEDGVDIFEGDGCYVIDKEHLSMAYYTMATDSHHGALWIPHKNVYFIHKVNAEQYIKEHEKKYSMNDVKKAIRKSFGCSRDYDTIKNGIIDNL